VSNFQQPFGPPFFVISVKAGGTGLNLTEACHVVHFDRWWNPAVEDQATDRAFRIGQLRNVLVHKFVTTGTLEERIDDLIQSKKKISREMFDDSGEVNLTEMSNDQLLQFVSLDINKASSI
jgi:non-specific serine/threonine protein kinase